MHNIKRRGKQPSQKRKPVERPERTNLAKNGKTRMNRKVMDWTKCSAKHGKVFVPYNAPVYDPEANGSAVVAWYEENAPHKLGDVAKWIRRSHDLELQARAKYEYDKALKGDK